MIRGLEHLYTVSEPDRDATFIFYLQLCFAVRKKTDTVNKSIYICVYGLTSIMLLTFNIYSPVDSHNLAILG